MLFENRWGRNPKEVSRKLPLLKTWTKNFGNEDESSRWGGYIIDEHRNAITLSPMTMDRWKKGRFKTTFKELTQVDNKKPEELEFNHFDVDNSYPNSPFKAVWQTSWIRFRVQTIT